MTFPLVCGLLIISICLLQNSILKADIYTCSDMQCCGFEWCESDQTPDEISYCLFWCFEGEAHSIRLVCDIPK